MSSFLSIDCSYVPWEADSETDITSRTSLETDNCGREVEKRKGRRRRGRGGEEREDGSESEGKRGRGAEGKVADLDRERSWSCVAVSLTVMLFFSRGVGSLHSVHCTGSLYCKLYAILYIPDTVLCNKFYSINYTNELSILCTILILYNVYSVLFHNCTIFIYYMLVEYILYTLY